MSSITANILEKIVCPLCLSEAISAFFSDKQRDYLLCQTCSLVFVPQQQHLDFKQEKAIYDLHQNHAADLGYRQFLSRLATPLLTGLQADAAGLDFGCGPGPVLADVLKQAGHSVALYDPFYADLPQNLQHSYDFISCSEVAEHFRQPQQTFLLLFSLLKPLGRLGLMTKLVRDVQAFSRWHYKNDQTHISFYSKTTLQWLADHYQCRVEFIGQDVAIFTAPAHRPITHQAPTATAKLPR